MTMLKQLCRGLGKGSPTPAQETFAALLAHLDRHGFQKGKLDTQALSVTLRIVGMGEVRVRDEPSYQRVTIRGYYAIHTCERVRLPLLSLVVAACNACILQGRFEISPLSGMLYFENCLFYGESSPATQEQADMAFLCVIAAMTRYKETLLPLLAGVEPDHPCREYQLLRNVYGRQLRWLACMEGHG